MSRSNASGGRARPYALFPILQAAGMPSSVINPMVAPRPRRSCWGQEGGSHDALAGVWAAGAIVTVALFVGLINFVEKR